MVHTETENTGREVAKGTALTVVIFSVTAFIPILGFAFAVFLPLPILFYRAKLGRSPGAVVALASMGVIALLIGRLTIDLLFFGELLLLGFVLSETLEKDLPVERTILYTCGVVVAAAGVWLLLISRLKETGIVALVSGYMEANLKLTLEVYERMGVSQEVIHTVASAMDQIQYVLVRILPALGVASVLFLTWSSLLLARPLLKNRNLFFPDFGALNLWKPPEQLVWAVIGCGVALLAPAPGLKMAAVNGLIVLMTVYFFGGIAIVSYFFEKKNFPPVLRVLLYSLIGLQQIALLVVIGLGFFDIWINFRKPSPPRE